MYSTGPSNQCLGQKLHNFDLVSKDLDLPVGSGLGFRFYLLAPHSETSVALSGYVKEFVNEKG